MTEFTKEYIQSVRMCSYLIEPPASEVLGNLCDHIERLQKRVQELEVQLKSKDIIINNQQGRLNYYATKDLLGEKKMSSDENIEKMKRNMPPETLNKAAQLYNQIFDAVSYHNKYKVMTNAQLANELMLGVWAEIPMWSEFSELLEVVIERLQGNENL